MTLLIAGGDMPPSLSRELRQAGLTRIVHWDGRKARHRFQTLPREVTAVLVLTDALSHDVLISLKKRAEKRGVPVYYCRRSRCSVRNTAANILRPDHSGHCT